MPPQQSGGVLPVAAASNPRLYRLMVRDIWKFFTRQKLSFQIVCIYTMLEYVRPQAIYEFMAGWPIASWAILLCLAAYVLEGFRIRRLTLIDAGLVAFSIVVLLSTLTAYDRATALSEMGANYFAWVLVFFLISSTVNTEDKFLVFMLLYLMWSYKMSQHGARAWAERGFSFAGWGISCAPQFFQNSGECGIQMAMYFPVSLYFVIGLKKHWDKKRRWILWFMPVSGAMTIMASSSRGAQLALVGVLLWMVLRSRQRFKALLYFAVSAAMLYAIMPEEQMERFRGMGTDETSMSRRTYWADGIKIIQQHPVLGIGYYNWLQYYRNNYNPKGELPHNIFVQVASELGYPGLLALIFMIIATFLANAKTRRLAKTMGDDGHFLWCMGHGLDGALIGFLISAFFVTVMYYPFFWFNLAQTVALFFATRDRHRRWLASGKGTSTLLLQKVPALRRMQPGMRGGLAIQRIPPHAS